MHFHPDCKKYFGKAKYRCMECKHDWTGNPGWQGDKDKACPKCPSQFCEWLNYLELFSLAPRR